MNLTTPHPPPHPPLASHWSLDPWTSFLNHGSFGACPREVLDAQQELRDRLERQPVQFLARDLEALVDDARQQLASFVGAEPEGLAFVANATTGVNAVLSSVSLRAGDELLTTDHAYNACRNALEHVAARTGARVVVAPIPFPIQREDCAVDAVLQHVTSRTRLALIDHITSPTALVLPVERIVAELNRRGVDSLIDGAHAPGMIELDLASLGAAWYTGNCHKWLCAPKGAAFLSVRQDKRQATHPAVISHGARTPRKGRSPFRLEFDWTGTQDPSPWLCVPTALRFMGSLMPGGWKQLMAHNHALALSARDKLCAALEVPPPAPDSMLGAMAAVPLPKRLEGGTVDALGFDPVQNALLSLHRIEVPIIAWSAGRKLVRPSAQVYNQAEDYDRLARALLAIDAPLP